MPETFCCTFNENNMTAVIKLGETISNAIEITFNPVSTQFQRQNAFEVFERSKDDRNLFVGALFYLYQQREKSSAEVRTCALQLLEQFIKATWNDFSVDQQDSFKPKLINIAELAQNEDPFYLKEAVAKVAVEVVKRVWPQNWTSLFPDLFALRNCGPAQIEIVILLLMRLSEDINGLDTYVTTQRKRDMLATIYTCLDDIFCFFLTTLNENIVVTDSNKRIAEITVIAITTFASWVKFEHLFKDATLFRIISSLLQHKQLKFHACSFLQVIFERKGTPHQRIQMMEVMDNQTISIIQNVAKETSPTSKDDYLFLKKLSESLLAFTRSNIQAISDEDHLMKNLLEFSRLVLQFYEHESLIIKRNLGKLWLLFLCNGVFTKENRMADVVVDILEQTFNALSRLSDPRLSTVSSLYSQIDFDDIDEFYEAFGDARSTAFEIIKGLNIIFPRMVLQVFAIKIKQAINLPPPVVRNEDSYHQLCLSVHYISWEALGNFAKSAVSISKKNGSTKFVSELNELYELVLNYRCQDAIFVYPVVMAIEGFYPLFEFSQIHLLATLQQFFRWIDLNPPHRDGFPTSMRMGRFISHAFSNLCKKIPKKLVPIFGDLQNYFQHHFNSNVLTNHEKGVVLEGMLTICQSMESSNEHKNVFILDIFSFVYTFFNRPHIERILDCGKELASFLGLHSNETISEESEHMHREMMFSLLVLQAVSRVCHVCKETDISQCTISSKIENMFKLLPSHADYANIRLIMNIDALNEARKHVWVEHMTNILPKLFTLSQRYCELWTLEDFISPSKWHMLEKCNHDNPQATNSPVDENFVKKIDYYLFSLHDIIYNIFSYLGFCVGPAVYSLPGISEALVDRLANPWLHLPDGRIRKIWKSFMKRFVYMCPRMYRDCTLASFLAVSMRDMVMRLSNVWSRIETSNHEVINDNDKHGEEKEMADNYFMGTLAKEYIDTLVMYCTYSRSKNESREGGGYIIGDLGEFMLQNESTNLILLYSLCAALTWPDAHTVIKTCNVLISIVKKLFNTGHVFTDEVPNQMLTFMLQGMNKHSVESAMESIFTNTVYQFYVHMRMRYPNIVSIMLMVPTCTEENLKLFDLNTFESGEIVTSPELKKDFNQLLKGACGLNVSRLHASRDTYKDLFPLPEKVKHVTPFVGGLSNLFQPVDD